MPNLEYDYLKKFNETNEEDRYRLVHNWIKKEPLPFFKQLREESPVLVTPECTLVASFCDVRDLLQMPKIFTVDLYKPKMGVSDTDQGYLMAHDDDALHYREKSIMQGMLNRDDLPRIRKLIQESSKSILNDAQNRIELVNNYCRMVPVDLVQKYFGLDCVNKSDLITWSLWNQYDAFNNQPFDLLTDEQRRTITDSHDQASKELVAYIGALIARKWIWIKLKKLYYMFLSPIQKFVYRVIGMTLPQRHEDMVTRMLNSKFAKETNFPIKRVGVNAGGLLIGSIETTSQAVTQVVEYFIKDSNLLKKAKSAASQADLTAFDAMVWEALRFVPIRPDIFRQAAEDYTIGIGTDYATHIKKGTIVRLLTQSAMFDPKANENPDEFIPERNLYHNFTLGFGSHECLGKYIGMEMIPEMVRQVVLLDNVKSRGPINYRRKELPGYDGPFPEEFRISWDQLDEI